MEQDKWNRQRCRRYADGLRPLVKFDHRPWARRIFGYLGYLPVEAVVVEVAAGPAFLLLELAGLLRRPDLVALDASPHMLEIAKAEAIRAGHEIRTVLSPAEEIRMEDGGADLVICKQLLHETEDPRKVVGEIARILRTGGHACCIDFDADGSYLAARMLKGVIQRTRGRSMADGFWNSFRRGLAGKSVKAMMEGAGLSEVVYRKRGPNFFLAGVKL
jgi:ubiquinone/menaquinone biosynthesis C-methylase UbiE